MELLALRSLAVSLLGEDLAMFWTRTPSEWPFFGLPAFSLAILVSLELISFLVFLALELATPAKSYVNPGGRLIQRRDCADFSCIWINKLATVPFMLHMMKDLHLAPQPLPSSTLASVLLPVPLLFLAYDAMYSPFHYFLHWPGVYPYIHKHHHRQVAPHRGLDDAVNTHPIEYAIGMWMHLFALWALRDLAGLPISPWAVLIFVFGGSLLAAVNHTRIEVKIPYLFNSLEHDTHHRFSSYNYAQYTQLFDWMVGTFKEWSEPPALPQRATPAPPLATLPSCPKGDAPAVCVVTGGSGLVGARLVAMLLERGAQRVLSLDLTLPPPLPPSSLRLRHAVCDITSAAAEEELAGHFEGASAVFHCAALVGPGFPAAAYWAVNAGGTAAVTAAAARAGVRVLVLTSSPTILLKGGDVRNAGEADLVAPATPQEHLHEYSRSKAEGTWAGLRAARAAGIAACAVAPHQVYGPRDRLFLPALLRAARGGLLRVFGPGDNLISLCHVDNCAHAHILAAGALRRGDRGVEGELFLVTDTGAVYLWDAISAAAEQCGLGSLENRCHLSPPLLYAAAYASAAVSAVMTAVAGGRSTTFTPFAVRMLLIDRWFDVSKAVKRLGYRPLVSFQREWPRVVAAAWERIQEGQPAALEVGTAAAAAVPPAVGAPCAALKGRSSSAAKRRSYT